MKVELVGWSRVSLSLDALRMANVRIEPGVTLAREARVYALPLCLPQMHMLKEDGGWDGIGQRVAQHRALVTFDVDDEEVNAPLRQQGERLLPDGRQPAQRHCLKVQLGLSGFEGRRVGGVGYQPIHLRSTGRVTHDRSRLVGRAADRRTQRADARHARIVLAQTEECVEDWFDRHPSPAARRSVLVDGITADGARRSVEPAIRAELHKVKPRDVAEESLPAHEERNGLGTRRGADQTHWHLGRIRAARTRRECPWCGGRRLAGAVCDDGARLDMARLALIQRVGGGRQRAEEQAGAVGGLACCAQTQTEGDAIVSHRVAARPAHVLVAARCCHLALYT